MPRPTPPPSTQRLLAAVRLLCQRHGLFINPVAGGYAVYRRADPQNIRLGRRSKPGALSAYVCTLTNTPREEFSRLLETVK